MNEQDSLWNLILNSKDLNTKFHMSVPKQSNNIINNYEFNSKIFEIKQKEVVFDSTPSILTSILEITDLV